jgi:hypothetical protein
MLTREKLFPGQEQEEQLQMIIELLGYPGDGDEDEELEILKDFKDKEALRKIGKNASHRFDKRFEKCPQDAVDLLK